MKKLILIVGLLLAANGHAHDELFPTCPSPHDPHSADAKENIQPYKAISKKPPRYPDRALTRGLEGKVILEYTINTEGRAVDIKVAGSTDTIFNEASIRAAKKFVYEPSINLDTGFPRDTPGVRHSIIYELKGSQRNLFYITKDLNMGFANEFFRVEKMPPKSSVKRINRNLKLKMIESNDLRKSMYLYLRATKSSQLQPRNVSNERKDLESALSMLLGLDDLDPNVFGLTIFVIKALNRLLASNIEEITRAADLLRSILLKLNQFETSYTEERYDISVDLGVAALNLRNWCVAHESFNKALKISNTLGNLENPNLKKFRDMAKERL